MNSLILLLVGHYLGDFALQNDYVAKFKTPGAPNWVHCMTAHCAIQAGTVYLVTHSPILAWSEFCTHFLIDVSKCRGLISFNQDQFFHISLRVIWAFLFTWFGV